ncbi:MAG: mechanosensitive ion channel family protein, partial [Pseudomonadota bacterium]
SALLLPATAQIAPGGEDAAGEVEVVADERVTVDPTANDDEIEERLRRILDAARRFDGVEIEVDQGVAFLRGEVADAARRQWVGDLAGRTEGVVAVVNAIETTPPPLWSIDPAAAELRELGRDATAAAPLFVIALVILPLAWLASALTSRLARRLLRGSARSPFLKRVIARAVALPIFLLGVYIVLQTAGLTQLALSVIGGAGVIGIVVGFAFRDIAENFLASLLLSIRQPFRRGDFIEVAGQMGSVQSMNTRSTLLLSLDGNHIQIPNAAVFKSTIVNYTSHPARRETLAVGVGYDAAVSEAQEIISDILARHPMVLDEPPPLVLVDELGGSTVNLKAYFWFDGADHSPLKLRSALLRQVKVALMEKGVSMPDDAREVIFPQGVPILRHSDDPEPKPAHPPAPRRPNRDAVAATESEGALATDLRDAEDATSENGGRPDDEGDLLTG